MKKIILLALSSIIFINSFGQKVRPWKTNVGFEFGIPIAGLSPSANNPLVQGGATLHNEMGYSGSFFIQSIKTKRKSDGRISPSFGFQIKALYNNFVSVADGVFPNYDDQTFTINEYAVPVLLKICLGSHEGEVSPKWDADKIEIKQVGENKYEVSRYPGQYHAGYRTTFSTYIYAGPQISFLQTFYNSSSAAYKSGFNNAKQNMKSTNLSAIGGIQFVGGRIYLDISYQRGLLSIYNGADVFIHGWIGRFGILF